MAFGHEPIISLRLALSSNVLKSVRSLFADDETLHTVGVVERHSKLVRLAEPEIVLPCRVDVELIACETVARVDIEEARQNEILPVVADRDVVVLFKEVCHRHEESSIIFVRPAQLLLELWSPLWAFVAIVSCPLSAPPRIPQFYDLVSVWQSKGRL